MAALLTGQSVSSVARDWNMPKGTVSRWKYEAQGVADPKSEIGELLLDYLRAALRTLCVQQEMFSDQTYLRKQPASELAVLHGVIADKAIRILEGIAANAPDDGGGAAEV